MSQIFYITKEDIENKDILFNSIYSNNEVNYYYSDNFDCEFYIKLAQLGFISVSHYEDDIQYLLPEMQFEYAVLEFKNLHISKKVNKLLLQPNRYKFCINQNFEEVLTLINIHHKDNWISNKYLDLIQRLQTFKSTINFKIISCELYCTITNQVVAGEIGYKIGSTYTSLSGFSIKEKRFNNFGKLQMVLLSKYLEENGFLFWNLGHPYMQYKLDLGAKVLSRIEFLEKWLKAILIQPTTNESLIQK